LHCLSEWGYRFPPDDDGNLYRVNTLRQIFATHLEQRTDIRAIVETFEPGCQPRLWPIPPIGLDSS
jgi:hypothetical protein